MAINLKKGSSFNLTKEEPGLKKAYIGLGWEFNKASVLDIDVSLFMLGSNGKLPEDEYFVFYNNLKSPDGSVKHTGDNRSGMGDDDDEVLLINLDKVDPRITEILIVATIHDGAQRGQNFGMLNNAYLRIIDADTKKEILDFDLDASVSSFSDVEFGKLSLENGQWHFKAVGNGKNIGLQGFVDTYA